MNELITADNQPAPYCGIRKRCSCPLGGGYQSMIGSKRRRQLRHLADCISESGNVHIVMRGFAADDHIAHFQALPQTARAAGVDDAVGREFEDGRGSGRSGIDFAYPAQRQHNAFAVQFAAMDFKRAEMLAFTVVQTAFQQLDFGLHGADNGNSADSVHPVSFPKSGKHLRPFAALVEQAARDLLRPFQTVARRPAALNDVAGRDFRCRQNIFQCIFN